MRKKSGNIASKFAAPFSFEMKKRGTEAVSFVPLSLIEC